MHSLFSWPLAHFKTRSKNSSWSEGRLMHPIPEFKILPFTSKLNLKLALKSPKLYIKLSEQNVPGFIPASITIWISKTTMIMMINTTHGPASYDSNHELHPNILLRSNQSINIALKSYHFPPSAHQKLVSLFYFHQLYLCYITTSVF